MAIGARSQSARTFLEKHVEEFPTCNLNELISFALRALRDTLPPDVTPGLTAQNTAIGFLGLDSSFVPFKIIEDEVQIQAWLEALPPLSQRSLAPPQVEPMHLDEGQQ